MTPFGAKRVPHVNARYPVVICSQIDAQRQLMSVDT